MSEICILTEQGSDNLGFLGPLNEEDQKTYEQSEKEEEAMRRKAGEPTK
jgi:hypothetical protein